MELECPDGVHNPMLLGPLSAEIEVALKRFWLNDLMFFVGIILMIQSHIILLCPELANRMFNVSKQGRAYYYAFEMIDLFGRNIVILQFYYNHNLFLRGPYQYPFVFSIGLVVYDTVILDRFARMLKRSRHWWSDSPRAMSSVAGQLERMGKKQTVTLYADFRASSLQIGLLFFAQFGLFLTFMISMVRDKDRHSPCNVTMLQWMLATAVTLVKTDATGDPYDAGTWFYLRHDEFIKQRRCALSFRHWSTYIVNGFCRNVLLAVVPIVLASTTDAMDFIKDALAIQFISTLDDIDGPPLREMIEELQAFGDLDFDEGLDRIHDVEDADAWFT